ncbi:MAG: acyl carrier protein [Fimbriimonas sp.]|nr:acyl carrier protein [Fimbriimonas sp.]
MTRAEFLDRVAELMEMGQGSLTGDETLEALGWDSLCALSFIVLADEEFQLRVTGSQMRSARSVQDLLEMVNDRISV